MHNLVGLGIGFVVFTGGLFLFILGLLHVYDRRLIENTPTSKCRSLAMGPVELVGRARGPNAMASLIGQLPCFISQVRVQQLRERGNHERRWVQVHKQEFRTPFYVEDQTGRVKVDPHGAALELIPDLSYSRGEDVSQWSDGALEQSLEQKTPVLLGEALARYCNLRDIAMDAPTRFVETNLCDGDPVYVLGTATEQEAPGADRVIIRSSILFPLLVSENPEQQLDGIIGRRARFRLAVGALANLIGAGIFMRAITLPAPQMADGKPLNPLDLIPLYLPFLPYLELGALMSIPFIALIGLLAYAAIIYNGFVMLRNQVDQAWANIDVLLKQRFDLIPNLVETCKAYMQHERETLETVVEARTSWSTAQDSAQKLEAARQSSSALRGVFAVAENYPLLRANETFAQFQKILSDLEAQIADRRELYNAAVTLFNNRIARVPDLWVAKTLGYKPRPFFAAESRSTQPVDVQLPPTANVTNAR